MAVALLASVLAAACACGDSSPTRPIDGAAGAGGQAPEDRDHDGYGAGSDCDDGDSLVHPGAADLPYDGVDQDCSGSDLVDVDGDGSPGTAAGGPDCDDDDDAIHPGATDLCGDGIDQDCSGGDSSCPPADGDGDGAPAGVDCDDTDPSVHPGADEIPYDGVDQDCSGADLVDIDGDGFVAEAAGGDDCDDRSAAIRPGAGESCDDGLDQDCSGADLPCADADLDGDGFSPNSGDCNDGDPLVHPRALEVPYDGEDQDCSGADLTDVDRDCSRALQASGPDCDDQRADVYPGARDICGDGIDQNCDGLDPVCPTAQNDGDGDGHADARLGGDDCDDARPDVSPDAAEVALDGLDQDCDGSDEVGQIFSLASSAERVAVASSGSIFLAAWTERDPAGVGQFMTQPMSADGWPLGAPQALPVDPPSDWTLLVGGDMEFLAVWEELREDAEPGDHFSLRAQRIGLDGLERGGRILVADGIDLLVPGAFGVTFGPGGYLLTWREWADGIPPSGREDGIAVLRGALIQTGGTLIDVGIVHEGAPEAVPHSLASVAADPGGYLVVWESGEAAEVDLYARHLSVDAVPDGPPFPVSERPGQQGSAVPFYDGANYVVVFDSTVSVPPTEFRAQFVTPGGLPLYSPATENLLLGWSRYAVGSAAAVIARGALLTAWLDSRTPPLTGVGRDLYAQWLDLDGTLLDTSESQNLQVRGGETLLSPQVELASDGTCVLAAIHEDGPVYWHVAGMWLGPELGPLTSP